MQVINIYKIFISTHALQLTWTITIMSIEPQISLFLKQYSYLVIYTTVNPFCWLLFHVLIAIHTVFISISSTSGKCYITTLSSITTNEEEYVTLCTFDRGKRVGEIVKTL